MALSAATILDACKALALNADTAPVASGALTINGNSLGNFAYSKFTGNQTVSAFSSATYFTATADSESAFVIIIGDLTINAGQVFQPASRKLFTVIYVTGNLIVNGQISMSQRGANHSSTGSNISAADILIANGSFSGVINPKVPAAGGAGGTGAVAVASGNPGTAGSSGGTGGGGSGGGRNGTSGAASAGTAFTGGVATGGMCNVATGSNAPTNGGAGTAGVATSGNQAAGGGAGNPGGAGATGGGGAIGGAGASGTGGTLIAICLGAYSGSGTVTAAGAAGGSTSGSLAADSGGGGSGGGSVNIIAGANTGGPTPTALGGVGGTATLNGDNGGKGGDGTARILLFVWPLWLRGRTYLRR